MTTTDPIPTSKDESDQQPLKKIKISLSDEIEVEQPIITQEADCSEKSESQLLNKVLTESDVHITEFMSPNPGFQAIIKHRFSDFMVNEVVQGKVVHLTLMRDDTVYQEVDHPLLV